MQRRWKWEKESGPGQCQGRELMLWEKQARGFRGCGPGAHSLANMGSTQKAEQFPLFLFLLKKYTVNFTGKASGPLCFFWMPAHCL